MCSDQPGISVSVRLSSKRLIPSMVVAERLNSHAETNSEFAPNSLSAAAAPSSAVGFTRAVIHEIISNDGSMAKQTTVSGSRGDIN